MLPVATVKNLLFNFKAHLEILLFLVFQQSCNMNLLNDIFLYLVCLQLSDVIIKNYGEVVALL